MMIVETIWICITVIVFMSIQWLALFRKAKGSAGEKAASVIIMLAAAGLLLALFNDWLTASPLTVLRYFFMPAAKALQQWGMAGG